MRPILEFASIVWIPYTTNLNDRIEQIQTRFVLFALLNQPWHEPNKLSPYLDRCRLIAQILAMLYLPLKTWKLKLTAHSNCLNCFGHECFCIRRFTVITMEDSNQYHVSALLSLFQLIFLIVRSQSVYSELGFNDQGYSRSLLLNNFKWSRLDSYSYRL